MSDLKINCVVYNGSYVRSNPDSSWVKCPGHQWEEVTGDYDNYLTEVVCKLCGVPGELNDNGLLYWPTT